MKRTTLGARQVDPAEWRLLLGALRARFETGSYAAGAAFVASVGRLADGRDHHLDIDLRAGHVRCALRSRGAVGVTERADVTEQAGVTDREVRMAERISALAADHGLRPRPEQLQVVELALDTPVADTVHGFWAAVLTGRPAGEASVGETGATGETATDAVPTSDAATGEVVGDEVAEPGAGLPPLGFEKLWFQATGSTAPDRQRFHLDVTVPPEEADRRVAAALDAGGRVVDDSRAPAFVVLADPDGNRACVCTELGRD